MNWREAIENLDRSENNVTWVDDDALLSSLAISGWVTSHVNLHARLKKYWVSHWLCTDTNVGLVVYVLDGEPVAISAHSARKNEEEIEFLSEEMAVKTRGFILSLL